MGHGRVHARGRALSARCWRRRQAAWLRLAGHQTASELGGAVGGARRQGAIAAKKVAVLRRAVARLPQSERMRRALLRECEACLPADELQREWELQLRELPTALGLWAAYLESVARAFSSFSMPAYREAATRALAALAAPLAALIACGAFWRAALRAAYGEPGRLVEPMIARYRWPAQVAGAPRGVACALLAQAARLAGTRPADTCAQLVAAELPILLVHGGRDRLVPPANSRALARALGAELLELPDCGHCPHEERPEAVAEAISAFARRHGMM